MRAEPKMLTAGPTSARASKPSTNSPMMRSVRHVSLSWNSTTGPGPAGRSSFWSSVRRSGRPPPRTTTAPRRRSGSFFLRGMGTSSGRQLQEADGTVPLAGTTPASHGPCRPDHVTGRILLLHLLRRVAALTALSVMGIALLAPLSARSARPDPVVAADRLLAGAAGPAAISRVQTAVARSALSIRDASASAATHGAEPVAAQPLPTPASAPMEATIIPNQVAAAPQVAAVYADGDTVWDQLAQ